MAEFSPASPRIPETRQKHFELGDKWRQWGMKISVSQVALRDGHAGWLLFSIRKGTRVYFQAKADAESEQSRLQDQARKTEEIWMALSAEEKTNSPKPSNFHVEL